MKKILTEKHWLVPISFLVVYLPGLIYAMSHNYSFPSGNLFTLLTSWFNPTEDWQSFSNVWVGILLDFIVPTSLFALAAHYSNIIENQFAKYLSVETIFVNGIVATYIVSGLEWYLIGTSGSGTSILTISFYIAFSIVILLYISTRSGLLSKGFSVLKVDRHQLANHILLLVLSAILLCLFLLVSLVSIYGYISTRQYIHFVGFGVFCVLTSLQILDRWYHRRRLIDSPRKKPG